MPRHRPRLLAVSSALAAALLLAACGSSGSSDSSAPDPTPSETGVLEGVEFGTAKGSTEEVPLDRKGVSKGKQPSLTTAAVVLNIGRSDQYDPVEFVSTSTVTPEWVKKGEIDPSKWDAKSRELVKGLDVYHVRFRVAYASGKLAKGAYGGHVRLYRDGKYLDPGVFVTFPEEYDECGKTWTVESFGVGAYYDACSSIYVPKGAEPTELGWAGVPDASGVVAQNPQVLWPIS